MKYKIILTTFLVFAVVFFITACNDDENKARHDKSLAELDKPKEQAEVHGMEYKPGDVALAVPLNPTWVASAKPIYEMKCQSCHKLTDERIVGPGWKGVTTRREPHWIMNMITNVDMMLEKDPEAQKLLEQCLVRMPNQNLSKDEARQLLEFMRNNDGVK